MLNKSSIKIGLPNTAAGIVLRRAPFLAWEKTREAQFDNRLQHRLEDPGSGGHRKSLPCARRRGGGLLEADRRHRDLERRGDRNEECAATQHHHVRAL